MKHFFNAMKFINCVLFFCLMILGARGGVVRNDTFRLDIVHYNDFHARFEETSITDPVCKSNDNRCIGGFARLYYGIKQIMDEKPGALLLNAGDCFQGTYWYTMKKHKVMSTFINMLPNAVHTLGNHEFDDGVAGLQPYMKDLKDPVVVANMNTTLEPSLKGLYQPHVVVERKGRRVGVIGVTTPDTPLSSNPGRIHFEDPFHAVQREAKILTDKGVDIIIVLSHCGLNVDKQMAKEVGENVDVIVGGHSHSLLWNGPAPSNEFVSGVYPEQVESEKKPGHKVLVVTASAYSKYLGHIGVNFDTKGDAVSFDAEPVYLNRSITEDPGIKALLKPYMEELHAALDEVVGKTNENLTVYDNAESTLGDLIADAYLDMAKEKNPLNLTSFAFFIKNMIRANVNKGDIALKDVINVLPFTNKILSLKLQGQYVKQFLQQALQTWPMGKNVPQVAGLQLTVNATSSSVLSALVKEGDQWKPIDSNKEYLVVMPEFVMNRVEIVKLPNDVVKDLATIGIDRDIVSKYIKKKSPITPSLDGRLVIKRESLKND